MRQSSAGGFLSRATRPTLSNLCDSRSPLCVGLLRDSTAFSLVRTLPSTTSAEANTSLFGGFTGTMVRSDSSAAYMSGLRLSPSRTGLLAQTPRRPPGSRACCFSTCMGSPTTPGQRPTRDLTPVLRVGFPSTSRGRRPEVRLRSSIPSPPMPLSTLRQPPRDDPRKTRGQDGFAPSFPVGLFHPLQHAGLSRRSTINAPLIPESALCWAEARSSWLADSPLRQPPDGAVDFRSADRAFPDNLMRNAPSSGWLVFPLPARPSSFRRRAPAGCSGSGGRSSSGRT